VSRSQAAVPRVPDDPVAGKSTLLGSLAPDFTLNLASLATLREYVTQPERFEAELGAAPSTTRTVFIDEVQRIPALLDGVQAIMDAHARRFRFLLCGSSARKLRRGHANLLPGRIVLEEQPAFIIEGPVQRASHTGRSGSRPRDTSTPAI